jgi:hypothetical protein
MFAAQPRARMTGVTIALMLGATLAGYSLADASSESWPLCVAARKLSIL